ncbi:MAG TPA: ABC transporter permease [Cellvibrio sp.]
MEQFIHYLKASWISIKRAPLPYGLTILIMSLGVGVFFSNATITYWLNHDPLPYKSDKLFFPRMASFPFDCGKCEAHSVLSYRDIKKLSNTDIPSAKAAMFHGEGYARLKLDQPATSVKFRFTQRDFFTLFDVPLLAGAVWPDNNARFEVILSQTFAQQMFGKNDAVGENLFIDDRPYKVVAVLDKWTMTPKLYDPNNGGYLDQVEDIYLPLELAYDLNYLSDSQVSSHEPINIKKLATDGREKSLHQLQFWVQLDTPEKVTAYRQFMKNLVADEKAAGRHPGPDVSSLYSMSHILEGFHIETREMDVYARITLLFLLMCLFNASHLTLNRYVANQFEFGLRRALGASGWQMQLQLLADVLIGSCFTLVLGGVIALLGVAMINRYLPGYNALVHINYPLLISLIAIVFVSNYVVALYPSLRATFGNLSFQLKS